MPHCPPAVRHCSCSEHHGFPVLQLVVGFASVLASTFGVKPQTLSRRVSSLTHQQTHQSSFSRPWFSVWDCSLVGHATNDSSSSAVFEDWTGFVSWSRQPWRRPLAVLQPTHPSSEMLLPPHDRLLLIQHSPRLLESGIFSSRPLLLESLQAVLFFE